MRRGEGDEVEERLRTVVYGVVLEAIDRVVGNGDGGVELGTLFSWERRDLVVNEGLRDVEVVVLIVDVE